MSPPDVERVPRPGPLDPQSEDQRKLERVLADLWTHSETLVRKEVELAKAEYEKRVGHAKAALRRGAISAGLFHAAYLTTLATLVLLLSQWLTPWIASLLVALGASSGAAVFTWLGKEALDEASEPPRLTEPLTRPRAHSHT